MQWGDLCFDLSFLKKQNSSLLLLIHQKCRAAFFCCLIALKCLQKL